MLSSTSSSEVKKPVVAVPGTPHPHLVERVIPERGFLGMAAVALVLNVLALGAWEWHVRSLGYDAGYEDTPGLWARQRMRAEGAKREQLVLVGASRTLF